MLPHHSEIVKVITIMASQTKEQEILGAAIDATENDIFWNAFGRDGSVLDETGDRSLESMGDGLEGQLEPDDEGDEIPEEEEQSPDSKDENEGNPEQQLAADKKGEELPDPADKGRVPPGRLRQEAERARTAESERDSWKTKFEELQSKSQQEIASVNAKFDQVILALRQQQNAQPQNQQQVVTPDKPPDLYEDPQGYAEWVRKSFQNDLAMRDRRMEEMRIQTSMENAHARHGDAFAKAYETLVTLPKTQDNIELGQRLLRMPNPGEALFQWHKRNEVLRQVGDDPEKYRSSIEEETRKSLMSDENFRRQILEELRSEAMTGDGARPRNTVRLPKSLNGAPGSNAGMRDGEPRHLDNSDQAIFDRVMNSTRR